jgi:hypothetical protein
MRNAFLLAVELRARQYLDVLSSCILRPGSAARELVARPSEWRAGSVLLWLTLLGPHASRASGLLWGATSAALLAILARGPKGSLRWRDWLVLWGYCLLPTALFSLTVQDALFYAAVQAPFPLPVGRFFLFLLAIGSVGAIFASLRLLTHFVKETGGRNLTVSTCVALWSFFLGLAAMLLLEGPLGLTTRG